MTDTCWARPLSPYRASVLIVEDDADVRAPLERIMSRAGFATLVAETAEEAVLLAEGALPDLMLLDLMLPDAHGAQVLSVLEGHGMRPPVIVVTAVAAFAEKRRMFGLGVRDYISKPFDIHDLL